MLIQTLYSIVSQLRERIVILSDDGVFGTSTSTFDQLVTLRLELVILSDIAIERWVRSPDIKRQIAIPAT